MRGLHRLQLMLLEGKGWWGGRWASGHAPSSDLPKYFGCQ